VPPPPPPGPPPPPPGGIKAPPPPPPAVPPPPKAAALLAPVDRAVPAVRTPVEEPAEVAPQAARARTAAVTKTKPTRTLRPGDLVCGACGEGNAPTRKFCGRCGESLHAAEVVRTPWWRRILRRRGAKVIAADRRPGQRAGSRRGFDLKQVFRRVYRTGRLLVAVVVLVGGLVYAAYPPFRTMVDSEVTALKDKVTNKVDTVFVPVHAVKVTPSGQDPGHPGSAAVDEVLSTYWLVPAPQGANPSLMLTFDHPETLKRMIVHAGAPDGYTKHGRPALLLLLFSNQESDTINLQDTDKPQTVDIGHALQISSVRIEVAGTFPGGTPPDVAISEIELFALPVP
jgi:hypothetical protein